MSAHALDTLVNKLVIPEDVMKQATELHTAYRARLLETASDEGIEIREIFLSGSYARKTASGRLKDVDSVVVFADDSSKNLGQHRAWLKKTLEVLKTEKLGCAKVREVRSQSTSIGVITASTHLPDLDFVPATYNNHGGYFVWSEDRKVTSNPKAVGHLLKEKRDEAENKYLTQVIRLLKYFNERLKNKGFGTAWNRKSGEKPLASFVLELILYGAFEGKSPNNLPDATALALSHLAEFLESERALEVAGSKPLSGEQIKPASAVFSAAASLADKANGTNNEKKSLRRWRAIFPLLDKP